jgi:hypothetical protein
MLDPNKSIIDRAPACDAEPARNPAQTKDQTDPVLPWGGHDLLAAAVTAADDFRLGA